MPNTDRFVPGRIVEEELLVPEGRDLFPPALPGQQIHACHETAQNVLETLYPSMAEPKQQEFFRSYQAFMQLREEAMDRPDYRKADRVVQHTVAMLDNYCLDNMAPDSQDGISSPRRVGYYRETGDGFYGGRDIYLPFPPDISGVFFVTDRERKTITDAFKRLPVAGIVHQTEDLAKAIENPKHSLLIMRGPQQLATFKSMLGWEKKLQERRKTLLIPFRINDTIGGFGQVVPMILPYLFPPSFAPRQDVWEAMLKQGQILYQPDRKAVIKPETTEVFSSKEVRRKNAIYVADRSPLTIEGYYRELKEHYHALLDREHPHFGNPHILLTRSGVSANELATIGIAAVYGKLPAFIAPGWYSENEKSVELYLDLRKGPRPPDTTQAFFINHEPNCALFFKDKEWYETQREQSIAEVIEAANKNPKRPHVMVVDKTTDLLYASFASGQAMPKNLTVIETASITKHQRGVRNYFSGIVLFWGDTRHFFAMKSLLDATRGQLTPRGVVQFPRLRREELERVKSIHAPQEKILMSLRDEYQKDDQEKKGWRIEAYSRFAYVVPPAAVWIEEFITQASDEVKQQMEQGKYEAWHAFLSEKARDYESIFTRLFAVAEGTIEVGDSFGLTTTRLSNIGGDLQHIAYKAFFPFDNIIRISYGTTTAPEELEDFVRRLWKVLPK